MKNMRHSLSIKVGILLDSSLCELEKEVGPILWSSLFTQLESDLEDQLLFQLRSAIHSAL